MPVVKKSKSVQRREAIQKKGAKKTAKKVAKRGFASLNKKQLAEVSAKGGSASGKSRRAAAKKGK